MINLSKWRAAAAVQVIFDLTSTAKERQRKKMKEFTAIIKQKTIEGAGYVEKNMICIR